MKAVLHSFSYCLDFLADQVADVDDAQLFAQPNGIMNHPAWVIGHLAFACELLGRAIGMRPQLPGDWASRFATGSAPVAEGYVYGTKAELLATLRDAQSRMSERVNQLTDQELDAPFPVESYRDVFPTIRHALTQVLVGHTANHIGQVSVWRRAMGLPPTGRDFQ